MDRKIPSITVAIPCYNEELTITKVIRNFRNELPDSKIIVFDNNSKDKSAELARNSGAEVFFVKKRGKGNVIKDIFKKVNEDVLIMVDGDDTYLAKDVRKLMQPIINDEADMSVGNRIMGKNNGMNTGHSLGNKIFRWLLNIFFKTNFQDILSGYRVFSRDFYKNIPLLANGFEVETELTLQALEREYRIVEIPVGYQSRPEGSHSKIREFSDGSRIIFTIVSLFRDYRPMTFFSILGFFSILIGIALGSRVVLEYFETGLVLRLPTAVLSITFIILGFTSVLSGLTVSAINRRYRELENILKNK